MNPQEKYEQAQVLAQLRRDAATLAAQFRLNLRDLSAERPQVRRRYGICDEDGRIRIRLRHAKTGALLKYSSLIDTLCHELAHLQHFNHGRQFEYLYRRMLLQARRAGIYRPAPRFRRARPEVTPRPRAEAARPEPEAGAPVQLDLFA